jgi:uncharacterized membrane protein YhaH (DUF805 family)
MGFQDAIRSVWSRYVTISGRAPRSEYWYWVLFLLLAGFVLGVIDGLVFGFGENRPQVLSGLFSLATLLPSICVAGRRLHDRDMSAWWLLLWFIPVIGWLVLLYFYVTPGTPGPNRFGPDPLGPSGRQGRRPNVWDRDDDSFTRSSIPRTGPRTGQND